MIITSKNFANNTVIPDKYGCNAEDISPQLSWRDFPSETKSFVLVCHDPDSPSGNFIHWIIANIPNTVNEIAEGKMDIDNGTGILNDFGKIQYGGPCPGMGEHHYIFTVFALSTEKIDNINKDNYLTQIRPFLLDQANITGLYQKKNKH